MGNDKHLDYLPMRGRNSLEGSKRMAQMNGKATRGRNKTAKTEALSGVKFGSNRSWWARLGNLRVNYYRRPDNFIEALPEPLREKYKSTYEKSDRITLVVAYPNGRNMYLNLTGMTVPELKVLREIINYSIDEAIPISQVKDDISQEAYDEYDDDSIERIYRGVPEVFIREGSLVEYASRLRERLEGLIVMVNTPRSTRGLRKYNGPVDHGDEAGGVPEDDAPEDEHR